MTLSYANPGSGPSAGGIGWVNFENLVLTPGSSQTGVSGTLKDGTTITLDISLSATATDSYTASQPPVFGFFGGSNYTGILGNTILYSDRHLGPTANVITLSNIVVTDSLGNPVTNYTAVIADAESTNIGESWSFTTNAGNWSLFTQIGNNFPTLTGVGTQTATITGINLATAGDYLLSTESPTNITLTHATNAGNAGREGVSIGFAINRVILRKNIGARLDSNDQFLLDIQGSPSDQAITTGTLNGIQSQYASVFGFPGNSYTINEAMAVGSVNPLNAYTQTISATNASIGGLTPPIGTLPITFTPQLGDIIVYDILNSVPETFIKSVDKAFADLGDVLTYTVTIDNPNDYPITNVAFNDPQPAGTSFVDIVSVGASYTGTNPATGLTILSIGANSSIDIVWRVKVTSALPMFDSINNVGNVNVPGGTSGSTNVATTLIKHADLISQGNFVKSTDPANVNIGDIITYTLTVKNTGNAAANNVVITDPVPNGTSYVNGSVTSTATFIGDPTTTIKLTAPIAGGQSVTITFKVKVGNTIPSTNPIPNQAEINYSYTVDPADPNGVKVDGFSNTTNTLVSNATLVVKKVADKKISYVGDKVTYNISITNTGNVPANDIIINDPIPNGSIYVPGSLTVNVPYSGSPATAITLTAPVAPGEIISISFQIQIVTIPNPNPINNIATVNYAYTVNPLDPNGVIDIAVSNIATTLVLKYNFSQEITDLIESIALEEAALAAIADAEGKKIQAMVSMNQITSQDLLCLNKSVADMLDSITILQSILKQKLNTVLCQIDPPCI